MFQSGGVIKLTEINFYTPTSELEQHRHQLKAYFSEHPPASINEAMRRAPCVRIDVAFFSRVVSEEGRNQRGGYPMPLPTSQHRLTQRGLDMVRHRW